MFKEKWEALKIKMQKPKEEEGKIKNKKIENLVVFVIILIITIIAINMIWKDSNKESNNTKQNTTGGKTLAGVSENKDLETTSSIVTSLEQRLENMLANMQGVGKTKVLITYSQSSQTVALYNEDSTQSDTDEKDSRRRQ